MEELLQECVVQGLDREEAVIVNIDLFSDEIAPADRAAGILDSDLQSRGHCFGELELLDVRVV